MQGGCATGIRCLEDGADRRPRNGHASRRHRSFWQEVARSPGARPRRISYETGRSFKTNGEKAVPTDRCRQGSHVYCHVNEASYKRVSSMLLFM